MPDRPRTSPAAAPLSLGVRIKAVIFDCDGVLVDSEIISSRVWAAEAARYGYALTPTEFARRFAGRPSRDVAALISQAGPRRLPPEFAAETDEKVTALYDEELDAVPGIEALLALLGDVPKAVASSAGLVKLRRGLVLTNLSRSFSPHIYSAEQVARGKPAPDVFLMAAEKLEVEPRHCAVIEDSMPGIHAAKVAGMIPIGFTGTAPEPELHAKRLETAGAAALAHGHDEIPGILAAIETTKEPEADGEAVS